MKIKLTSVYVDDQNKALRFYTEVLGFTKKADFSRALPKTNAQHAFSARCEAVSFHESACELRVSIEILHLGCPSRGSPQALKRVTFHGSAARLKSGPSLSIPNCLAYSACSRCQPNFMASGPTMRPMGVPLSR